MREFVELRVPEENAIEYLPPGIGKDLGGVRKVVVDTSDPLFTEIGRLDRSFRARDKCFFYGWDYHRRYTQRELDEAKLLHVWPKRYFEPAGEQCGTTYEDAKACPECGAGAPQTSPLFLNGRRIPRKVDFAQTIAEEIVVSARVVELFREQGLIGARFDPVRLSNRRGAPSEEHFQLLVEGSPVDLDPATRAGRNPFDEDSYGRCSRGDVVGLNLLSEVSVKGQTLPEADVMKTRQMVGTRRGLLRPRPLLLLSPRAWRAIAAAELKGLGVEVAHVR